VSFRGKGENDQRHYTLIRKPQTADVGSSTPPIKKKKGKYEKEANALKKGGGPEHACFFRRPPAARSLKLSRSNKKKGRGRAAARSRKRGGELSPNYVFIEMGQSHQRIISIQCDRGRTERSYPLRQRKKKERAGPLINFSRE